MKPKHQPLGTPSAGGLVSSHGYRLEIPVIRHLPCAAPRAPFELKLRKTALAGRLRNERAGWQADADRVWDFASDGHVQATKLPQVRGWAHILLEYGLDDGPLSERLMKVSVTEAKGQLTELVRRAEAGDEVILTRHGHPSVRLVPIRTVPDRNTRRALLEKARISGALRATPGPSAPRSQDFLYGEDGLPE